jgi:hypothetical protein
MVGVRAKPWVLISILFALTLAASGQRAPRREANEEVETSSLLGPERASAQLLTADEGLAIIGAALEIRQASRTAGDCSHVVHAIYQQAGFSYGYADSSQLYAGIEDFRRVAHPQPGDLAVWRGHAAIVVNPAQHTFFGSTGSGLRVESYDLEYWKRQGPPRFFRYAKAASSSEPGLTRTATGTRPTLSNAESRLPLDGEDSNDRPRNSVATEDAAALVAETPTHPPHILVRARQPELQQVHDALSLYFDEIDKAAGLQDLLRLAQPLMVFDRIEVKDVHLKGRQTWADVKITGLTSLSLGHTASKKSSEQQRWTLTRWDANTWELQLQPKMAYLPRGRAVRILSHQLAALADGRSDSTDSSKDQMQLARMLNALLEK